MTSIQPFTSDLIHSNRRWFRQELIWIKSNPNGYLGSKKRHLRAHENILIFAPKSPTYHPQMGEGRPYKSRARKQNAAHYGNEKMRRSTKNEGERYPTSVLEFASICPNDSLHPTQKPSELFQYLIRTFSDVGGLVLDPFCGVGTTAIAAIATRRDYICGDINAEYVAIAEQRVAAGVTLEMFPDLR